jgi:dolichol-phosphate mannosyltransferase
MKISIIIPVYNEQNTIVDILKKIENVKDFQKQIIIVDDGSTDNSSELIDNFDFKSEHKIIKKKSNNGKGSCIQCAQKFINGDIVIIQDADLEYDPINYKDIVYAMINEDKKIVYGSRVLNRRRYNQKNFISIFRIFANHVLTILTNILFFQRLTDAHTCYKAFNSKIFNKIVLKENDFAFCPEITAKVSKLGYKIFEVPISYFGRTYKEGKKISFYDGIRAVFVLFKFRFFK